MGASQTRPPARHRLHRLVLLHRPPPRQQLLRPQIVNNDVVFVVAARTSKLQLPTTLQVRSKMLMLINNQTI